MSESTVVAFPDQARERARAQADAQTLTMEALEARRGTISMRDCHVGVFNGCYEVRTKKIRFSLLSDLSFGVPRGRKIVVLGHKGSGKSTLLEILQGRTPLTRGRVVRNGRLSWPMNTAPFFDQRLTLRDNLIFCARVLLNCPPRFIIERAVVFAELEPQQLEMPMGGIRVPQRRRIGYLLAVMAGFDLYLIDGKFTKGALELDGEAGERVEELLFGSDYLMVLASANAIPSNADLAYILYDGRLFMFDDIERARETYRALPPPDLPDLSKAQQNDGGDDSPMEGF